MVSGGGISIQFAEVPVKIVLEHFLVEGVLKAIGSLDDNLNNERYNYVSVTEAVATPWHQSNPVKPIHWAEMHLRIQDILLALPLDSKGRDSITRMAHSEPVILYMGPFAVGGSLFMGEDVPMSGALEAMPKRFLSIADVSFFPMFPPRATLSEVMPIGLINRAKVSHYYKGE
jgi:hypothetical protein